MHIPFIAYRQFIIRAHVDDNILEFSGLLIALFTLDMLCWIISLIVLLWCLCCLDVDHSIKVSTLLLIISSPN